MKTNNRFILEICKRNKITDYLASKGVLPSGRTTIQNRVRYCCPIHIEKHPSFTLYTDSEYDNYYCYGCKAHGSIISLYTALEHVSFKEAIKHLGKDIDISDENELDYILHDLHKELEDNDVGHRASNDLVSIALNFSVLGYSFLEMASFDEEAVKWLDEVYKVIDGLVREEDLVSLEQIYEQTLRDKLFAKRLKYFREKQEKKNKEIIKERVGAM